MLDQDLKPWVIGLDAHPGFNIFFQNVGTTQSEVISFVDLNVKKMVVKETLQMALGKSYMGLKKIFPCEEMH